jgi:hypothetical protein
VVACLFKKRRRREGERERKGKRDERTQFSSFFGFPSRIKSAITDQASGMNT